MNLRGFSVFLFIAFIVTSCTNDKTLPDAYWGEWMSEEDGIYLNIQRDSIEVYSNILLSRFFPLQQDMSAYRINEEGMWSILADSVEQPQEKYLGAFSLLDSLLLITFEKVMGRRIFILKRPEMYSNQQIDKIQFSASECHGTCANYDVEINNSGEIIYHGISHCEFMGYGLSTLPIDTYDRIKQLMNSPKFLYNRKLLELQVKFSRDSQYFSIIGTGINDTFRVILDSYRTPNHMRQAIDPFWYVLDSYSFKRSDTNLIFTSRSEMENLFREAPTQNEYDFFYIK